MRNVIESKTSRIATMGTRIVSFHYAGKKRNCLLGAVRADDYPNWGTKTNPIFTRHNGKGYISAIDNNSDHQVKVFAVSKIRNPSF